MIDNITISVSVFFAFFITLYHTLHCLYVAKDPDYKGKLGIGWPWLHYNVAYLNKRVP